MVTALENLAVLDLTCPLGAAIVWFWVGTCIGSFLNVCIWRVPNGMSLISPPSHCPKCGHAIPFYENIPIFSWFLLKGKCSSCHDSISVRYPVVETLTAVVFLGIHLLGTQVMTPSCLALMIPCKILVFTAASVQIASAFTDCDCRIIPDEFVLTLLGAEILYAGLVFFAAGAHEFLTVLIYFGGQTIVMGILLSGIAMLGKALCHKTALGWGDVKLLTVLTPVMTLYGICWIILIASILLVVCTPSYRRQKPKMRHRAMPFAPFLAIAAAVVFAFLTQLYSLVGMAVR